MSQNPSSSPLFPSASHVLIAGGMFTSNITQIQTGTNGVHERRFLEAVAPSALHDAGHVFDLPKCHPGTRVAVIQAIKDWATGMHVDTKDKGLLWLTGAAGAGKTAIGKTVCDRSFQERTLLASFFFQSRDASRNHSRSLVATIAYQMCLHYPSVLQTVVHAINHDPLIFSRSLCTQLLSLVIGPLSTLYLDDPREAHRRLIVIDGLDECIDRKSQRDILDTLAHVLTVSPYPIRFLVCSRPENEIVNFFSSNKIQQIVFKIFLGHEYDPDEDIEKFLSDKLNDIKKDHIFKHLIPDDWPRKKHLVKIVENSSGQFIYADTVVRYVEDSHYQPHQRLDAILGLRPPFKDMPFAQLDALYTHILSTPGVHERSVEILAFPALYSEESKLSMIEAILDLGPGDVEVALSHFGSIIRMHSDEVQLLHKSFADFIFDYQRSKTLYLDRAETIASHIQRVMQDPLQLSSRRRGYEPYGDGRPISWYGSPAYLLEIIDVGYTEWRSPPYQAAMTSLIDFPMEKFCEYLFSDNNMGEGIKFLQHFFNTLYRFPRHAKINEAYHLHLRTFCTCAFEQIQTKYSNDLATNCAFASLYLRRPFEEADLEFFGQKVGVAGHPFFYRKDIRDMFRDIITDIQKSQILARAAAYFLHIICDRSTQARTSHHAFLQTNRLNRIIRSLTPWRRYRRTERYIDIHPDYFKAHRYYSENAKKTGGIFRGRDLLLEASWRLTHCPITCERDITPKLALDPEQSRKKICSISFCYQISKKRKFIVYHRDWAQSTLNVNPLSIFEYLGYLAELLPLAGHYPPLIDLCRTRAFPALTILLPHRALKARRAIAKYLRKNDPQNDTWRTGRLKRRKY